MGGSELEQFLKDAFWDQGSRVGPDYLNENPNFSIIPFLRNARIADNYEAGMENNWWDLLTRNGSIANYNLSLSGGGESVKYFVSGGLTDVKGFMVNENYKRYNYRINLDAKVNDWISVGTETFLTTSDYSGVSPNVSNAFVMYPWAPIYDSNGEYDLTPDSRGLNPLLEIQQDDSDKRMNLFANLHADIKLPFLKGFNYRVNYSQNYMTTNQDRFNPWGANYTGQGYKNSYINYDWILDNIISYDYQFNQKNKISATLLYGVEERNYSFTQSSAQNFINNQLGYNRLQAGDPALNIIQTGKERENSLYSMARLFYNRSDKYLLTGTIRRDGFSGFGSKSKIGYFPSIALGWVLSNEDFFENVESINYLKLRASYGLSGRRAAGRYATQPIVDSGPSYAFGDGSGSEQGQFITSLANDKLGWETTKGYNLGIDFGALNSRINGNIEYYDNNTRDILYDVQLPTLTGFSSISTNIGKVHNWGLEFNLNVNVIKNQNFSWQSGVVFSRNRNKIVSILGADNDQDGDGIEDDLIANNLFIGQPQNVNYNYNVIGMWQLSDKEAGIIPSGFLPGTYKLEDVDNDGSITAANDRKILGYQDPSFRMGWSNTVSYKNLSMYVFFNTIQGGKNYYQSNTGFRENEWHKLDQLIYSAPPKGGWDYWMPENPDAKYRRPDTHSQLGINTGPHQQRNFIRLQDVSIAYNLDSELIKKLGLTNFKIFLSGKNLFTWTKWEGWDPETGRGFVPGRPVMTNYTLGLNFEL
ncbi:MAG TPA: SusC/RagA family TonB-linked outer membrane protein, partial [Arenibacter sp.]|nr:SusC/RagA family TonB-linked outer membrane protein [Arenibacter sp.]